MCVCVCEREREEPEVSTGVCVCVVTSVTHELHNIPVIQVRKMETRRYKEFARKGQS